MGKKVKITEEQMRLLNELYLGEDSTDTTKPKVEPVIVNGKPDVPETQKKVTQAAGSNKNANNFEIAVPGGTQNGQTNQVNCSVVITKKQLMEYHMHQLKKNSNLYTVKDFIKNA